MTRKFHGMNGCAAFMISLLMALCLHPLTASAADAEAPADIVVKLSRLEETLDVVDQLAAPFMEGAAGGSPTMMIRGMLQGTDWIDKDRLIVLGIQFDGKNSRGTLLIPFSKPNAGFQSAFGAVAGGDHYLVALPPGPDAGSPSPELAAALSAASETRMDPVIKVEVNAARLLEKNRSKIDALMQKLEAAPSEQFEQGGLSKEQVRNLAVNIRSKAAQIGQLGFGLDLTAEQLRTVFELEALPGTELHGIFRRPEAPSLLGALQPEADMAFRTRPFDFQPMIEMFATTFGDFYKALGIDIDGLSDISRHFTGEMVSGTDLHPGGMDMSLALVMKTADPNGTFLEETYIPWMLRYGLSMNRLIEEQTGIAIEPVMTRTEDSVVAGHHVAGVRMKVPFTPAMETLGPASDPMPTMTMDMRMTVDKYFFTAPTDQKLAELIRSSESFSPQTGDGPLMEGSMDLGAYLSSLAGMAGMSMPDVHIGAMKMSADLTAGRAYSETVVNVADILALATAVGNMTPMQPSASPESQSPAPRQQSSEAPPTDQEIPAAKAPQVKDAAYYFDRAELAANYGNDKAAIPLFKKALAMDPALTEARFLLGVSYGEIGQYTEGKSAIREALTTDPDNGLYHYGLGRVLLLSGDQGEAIREFQTAADLGNEDAAAYLERQTAEAAGK